MATDDERRRVAAALREYASFDHECEDEEEFSVDCADWGERVINLLDCGDTEEECYAYLADLIDPECRHEEFCRVCGHVIPDGWSECPRCRSKVVRDDNR